MMDENKGENMEGFSRCQSCGCGGHFHCGHGHYHGHYLLRWLLGILLLVLVFALGVKIGELKAGIENYGGYGGRMMRNWDYQVMPGRTMMLNGGAPGNMMWQFNTTTTTTAPTAIKKK